MTIPQITPKPKIKDKDENDLVEALLRLPAVNLEKRIQQFESDINKRQNLNDQILTALGTQQLLLQDRFRRWAYASPFSPEFKARQDSEESWLRLETLKANESVACFKDLWQISDKMQAAREELETARQKLKLVQA